MLFQQMQELAAEMKFEEAQKIKEKYLLLENYRAKSEVVSNVLHNIDVFSIEEDSDEKSAFVNYLHITNGAINQAFTFEVQKRLNEPRKSCSPSASSKCGKDTKVFHVKSSYLLS